MPVAQAIPWHAILHGMVGNIRRKDSSGLKSAPGYLKGIPAGTHPSASVEQYGFT